MDEGLNADSVQTRDDFVRFVHSLLLELRERPDKWENCKLDSYLQALAAWVQDIEGVFENRGEPVPLQISWRLLAMILLASTVYE